MGVSQKSEDVAALIKRSLGIDSTHFRPCNSERGTTVSCLVHESWLKEIITGSHSNTKYIHPSSEYERQLMLQPSHAGPYPPWARICIKILRKPILVGNSERSISLGPTSLSSDSDYSGDLTVAELLQSVSKHIYRHNWNSALENYSLAMSYLPKSQQKQLDGQRIIRELTEKIFGLSVIQLGKKETNEISQNDSITTKDTIDYFDDDNSNIEQSNIVPLVCALENEEAFFFVEPFFRHGLHDMSTFSPAVLSHSTSHLLYVIYQALHGLGWFHKHGIPFGKLGLGSIRLDKGLFLYLTTPLFEDFVTPLCCLNDDSKNTLRETVDEADSTSRCLESGDICSNKINSPTDLDLMKPKHDLMTLVEMWVRDEITNFDYLMALNYFAGRRHGDPNYHPLFPWVTDFTTKHGGYRDLTKSKFRLNKGDHQLDMTYKQVQYETDSGSTAHHVSDVLSDITFHAYLARRTPVAVLCEHLRSNWVPNEYPSTMERLYSWTPDECIPQFFSDPTIFKSIHEDLSDLELPSWTATAEDFITWHREVLESEAVSRNLHQWIDLTFGYKLSGKAAVRAKNVCLQLVNKHQRLNNFGVVQLFNKPHPAQAKTEDMLKLGSSSDSLSRRFVDSAHHPQPFSMSSYLTSSIHDSMVSLDSIDEHGGQLPGEQTVKDSAEDNGKISEAERIYLPDDYNPLKLLETYEAIHKFRRQFPVKSDLEEAERPEVYIADSVLDKLIQHDIEVLGCIIVEMVLSDKVRLVSAGLSQQQKIDAIKNFCLTNPKMIPRYLRSGVLRMLNLQASPDSSLTKIDSSRSLHSWADHSNNPPLTTGFILHPQTGIFPFPSYFKQLHSFLARFNKARLQDRYLSLELSMTRETSQKISLEGLEHCFSNKSEYSTHQIDIASEALPELLPNLDEEGVYLLLYHLEPLFINYETRLYAFTHLFDTLAQCLGPKATAKTFLKPLIELCDSRLLQNYEHLVAQSFLSQIIVRFGLETFLEHFVNFAVDAVAFELMLEKTKRAVDRISVHSNEGISTETTENEFDKKILKDESSIERSLYVADGDAPLSDQEDDEDINQYDDPFDDQSNIAKRLFSCEEEERDNSQDENSSSTMGSLTVLVREGSSDVFYAEESNTNAKTDESVVETASEVEETDELDGLPENNDKDVKDTVSSQAKTTKVSHEKKLVEDDEENAEKRAKYILIKQPKEETVAEYEETGSNVVSPIDEPDSTTEQIKEDEPDSTTEQIKEDEDEAEETSGDSSDDEQSDTFGEDEFPETNQSDRPSADVFYQDTTSSTETKGTAQFKEELTPLYVSGIAAESIMWLAPRLGPVLTSKYLAKQLLTMLPQCYVDVVGVEEFEHEDEDRKAKWVLYCLGNFCALYGEAFVLYQYLPFAEKIVTSIHAKITPRGEASLAAVFALIKYCVPYMSKETLVQNFETLFRTVFQPVLRILSSLNTKFPGGGDARAALCHNYVDLLTVLSLKLERELAKELMTAPLQQFFSCFELVHLKKKEVRLGSTSFVGLSSSFEDNSQDVPRSPVFDGNAIKPEQMEAFYTTSMYEELCQTFSAFMAHHAYVPLCAILGSKYMESALYNHELIWDLCCSHDVQLSHPGTDDVSESRDRFDEGRKPSEECYEVEKSLQIEVKAKNENGEEVEGKTNPLKRGASLRIKPPSWLSGRKAEKRKSQDMGKSETAHTTASDQYLRGSWLDHWKNHLHSHTRSHGSRLNFHQIKLQTFTGHSGPVRSLYVQDSEHFFLSASKDKTVKLWSLSNHGDGTAQSASSWTYYRHSRGVFSVDMVESLRQAVSCDGSVHIWDPVHGSTIETLEPNKNSSFVAMVAMPPPSQTVVVATSETTARFIDVRQTKFVHEWKTNTSGAAGSVRDICCSPDGRWIALGFSSGLVSVLDVRGGLLRSQRRAHTSDVVQVRSFSNNSLFTSSMDQGLSLWKDDGLRLKHIKGHSEPLNLILVEKDCIVSSSIANRIGVHQLVDEQPEGSYTGYKLQPEVFRGNVTSLGHLQLNQLLLLGSDTGNITLCA